MKLTPAKPLDELLEKELEQQLIGAKASPGLARQLGWRCYHTLRSKGSEPGFPDWTLVRERVLFIECKTERGRLSEAQKVWLRALLTAGAEAYVVRPRHLQQIATVLSARMRYGAFASDAAGERARIAASELSTATRKEIGA